MTIYPATPPADGGNNPTLDPRPAKPITVVDARMGRGKSSAAIRYMNRHRDSKRFLYITPYLDEVGRICEQCDFDQTDGDYTTKSVELKVLLSQGVNIAATHSLFYLMDNEALELIREKKYSLIADESLQVAERINISDKDFEMIVQKLTVEGEDGALEWIDSDYQGRFSDYKSMADLGSLYRLDTALLNIMNPDLLRSFDEVFMLTYLFEGQYQSAYLNYFGFEYRIVGVERDENGYRFSDRPDAPPPIDYTKLMNIVSDRKMNKVGDGTYALSKNWFAKRDYGSADMKALRNGLRNFFRVTDSGSDSQLWTTFKEGRSKIVEAKTRRFNSTFLQVSARATNEYRSRNSVAYLANRFIDPNLMKLFASKDISVDPDKFALSEMLQWIWRSAIRDDMPINLYIPSKRMRQLLLDWIEEQKQGGITK